MEISSIINAQKWGNHSFHTDLWLKHAPQCPSEEMREMLFFLLCSCHSFDTEVNVFIQHTALFHKSVPVVLWPRGRFFQSHQRSQSWLLLSWEHLSSSPFDLHLSFSSESLQPIFMPTVLWPPLFLATPPVTKPAQRGASCACFCARWCRSGSCL